MTAVRLLVPGLIVFGLGLPALAGDRISQRAVFEDPTARLDFQVIQGQAFTPYSGILSRGYGRSALWVRLRIDPEPGDADSSLVLRIRPGYLDEVRLYDPVYRSLGVEVTGDRYPIAQDHYHSLNANLSIPGGNAPRDIWLRVDSTSSRLFQVQALSLEEALQQDRKQEIPYSLYLAFLTLTIIWAAAHWLMRRAPLLLLFTLKQTAGLIYMTGYLGYARVLWPASLTGINAGQLTDWTLPLYATLGCLFDYTLLRASRADPLGLRILLGLASLLLRMIIANLIDNACKYSGESSPITLNLTESVAEGRRQWCLRVVNLPGKAGPPDPERVFDKYYRAPGAHEFTGSGLGLFLAARLAVQLGGELRYRPTETDVIFELWMPV